MPFSWFEWVFCDFLNNVRFCGLTYRTRYTGLPIQAIRARLANIQPVNRVTFIFVFPVVQKTNVILCTPISSIFSLYHICVKLSIIANCSLWIMSVSFSCNEWLFTFIAVNQVYVHLHCLLEKFHNFSDFFKSTELLRLLHMPPNFLPVSSLLNNGGLSCDVQSLLLSFDVWLLPSMSSLV